MPLLALNLSDDLVTNATSFTEPGRLADFVAGTLPALGHAERQIQIEESLLDLFENILGEKVSTKPVDVKTPFSWLDRAGNKATK